MIKFATFLAVLLAFGSLALGQTYKVIWNFGGAPSDGASSVSNLISDAAGNLYGTTESGGNSTAPVCAGGCGAIFELTPNGDDSWVEKILYNFCANYDGYTCPDGAFPEAGLVFDSSGNMYGTTYEGGIFCGWNSTGCGTVFELSPPKHADGEWTESVLYAFCANVIDYQCLDGAFPTSQLVLDSAGNLYGTTQTGGSGKPLLIGAGLGTVFELSRSFSGWVETVLYNFCSTSVQNSCPDGAIPKAGVTFDQNGNLYGTTFDGGVAVFYGGGTIFELSPGSNSWSESVLYAFPWFGPGSPDGTISFDSAGNIYGSLYQSGKYGDGGVFQFNTVTHRERSESTGGQGIGPVGAVLIDENTLSFYGVASGDDGVYHGDIFQVYSNGSIKVIYHFCKLSDCLDGTNPFAGLTIDASGNLFGTTKFGGSSNNGVAFEITPSSRSQTQSLK